MKTNNKEFGNKEFDNKFADEVWKGIDGLQPHTLELVKSATALGFTAALNRVEDDIKKPLSQD